VGDGRRAAPNNRANRWRFISTISVNDQGVMPYNDFSLESVSSVLGVNAGPADLFPHVEPVPVPAWLREMLDRGMHQVLLSEKARSEFIVVPILLACQEMRAGAIAI
jgi:hypothetical protein